MLLSLLFWFIYLNSYVALSFVLVYLFISYEPSFLNPSSKIKRQNRFINDKIDFL